MKLFPLAVTAGLLPLFTIHLCYFIAAYNHHLPWCIPYFESCTSISAAGRQSPEFFVFKGLMIPAAVIVGLYWLGVYNWHKTLLPRRAISRNFLLVLAITACAGLVLYSVMLGAIGDVARWQRRLGVILFFALTFFAHAILALQLGYSELKNYRARSGLWSTTGLVLAAGIFALIFSAYDESLYDGVEDALEWTVALLLCLQPLCVASLWRDTAFQLQITVKATS